jgi:flagellar biogenesis protein FliO
VVAVLLWKILRVFLLPLIGIAVGVFFLVVKVVFVVVMVCVALWLFRRLARPEEKPA